MSRARMICLLIIGCVLVAGGLYFTPNDDSPQSPDRSGVVDAEERDAAQAAKAASLRQDCPASTDLKSHLAVGQLDTKAKVEPFGYQTLDEQHPVDSLYCMYRDPAPDPSQRYAGLTLRATTFEDAPRYFSDHVEALSPCGDHGCNSDEPTDSPNNRDDDFTHDETHLVRIDAKRELLDLEGVQAPVGTNFLVMVLRDDQVCEAKLTTPEVKPDTFSTVTNELLLEATLRCNNAS